MSIIVEIFFIQIDNLRPSLSTADMEGLPNLIGTIQAGLNYPHNERMEYTVNNLSSNNSKYAIKL